MRALRSALSKAALLLAAAALSGCTDSQLYSVAQPPLQADRVALSGRVCTEDPEQARFPVRLVLVADHANGPLFGEFDPGATRIQLLSDLVQSALTRPEYALAVVGFAAQGVRFGPQEGTFTRNPGVLLNAINRLSLPGGCLGVDQCRDADDGLRVAGTIIEDDLAAQPAGVRGLTQYVVVLVTAGLPVPFAAGQDCCPRDDEACREGRDDPSLACQTELDLRRVEALRALVADAGGGGLQLHALHLRADPDPAANDTLTGLLEQMTFAGGGRYSAAGAAGAIDLRRLRLFDRLGVLRAKRLVVANLNALPGPDGLRADADGDGLPDHIEASFGVDPALRDTDGDGIGDLVEVLTGQRPTVPDEPAPCANTDPLGDLDLDGLTDCEEALLGTDPSLVDSDGDGLPDRLEVALGTDYLNGDSAFDADDDGVPNGDEIRDHTDPRSADLPARLGEAYRYTVEDEGVVDEPRADRPKFITGVEVTRVSAGSAPGLGQLQFEPGTPPQLAWKDPADPMTGPPVDVPSAPGTIRLTSSSFADIQGEDGRFVEVSVDPAALPPRAVGEPLRVSIRTRQCLRFTVRNIRLLEQIPVEGRALGGVNDLLLYFAQAPEDRIESPGPFRLAQVRMRYVAPDFREPTGVVLQIRDEDFVGPRIGAAVR